VLEGGWQWWSNRVASYHESAEPSPGGSPSSGGRSSVISQKAIADFKATRSMNRQLIIRDRIGMKTGRADGPGTR
jgi:hypothetical protein